MTDNKKTPQEELSVKEVEKQIKSVDTWNGEVSLRVSGMKEFNELLERAKKEAEQLNNTIDELSSFELKLNFYEEK
ncbi:hypothetical protein [Turicibacter sanguinis]|uniref:hypothetical protein n=1 Tax=Turicibacter sanguinis TaxID=154288 RepID=UPI00232CD09D|nr:hypothetical protein [Turicibacter sanguinis]MDB8574028.1 hypothetical protein [Turicibacter sanguinis]MDB8576785.1 hypothetical protein [Turicibacter sanguinis]MDB8582815.1 hypothetical protein [Turicibacter sanguinis]MDB8587247.1 hypothetical protein [Turicibacter sanguinis]MDB8596575.1 hypothetical protein [Turicibacter sanguinis]